MLAIWSAGKRLCNWSIVATAIWMAGCASRSSRISPPIQQPHNLSELRVIGPWSPPADGLRCRVLLQKDRAQETEAILAAFAIENASNRPALLRSAGPFSTAGVIWKAGSARMTVESHASSPAADEGTLTLAPGQIFTTEPARIVVPPESGRQPMTAQLALQEGRTLSAPAVELGVAPAQWGQTVDGLRLRIAPAAPSYAVGEQPRLHLFASNTTSQPLVIHAPDWSTLHTNERDNLVVLSGGTDDNAFATIEPGGLWIQPIDAPLLLAPGTYRVRLTIDSPELPAGSRPAWHGRISSNDAPLEIRAK